MATRQYPSATSSRHEGALPAAWRGAFAFCPERDAAAAWRAAQTIEQHFALLETNPTIGRPVPEKPEQRELVIRFGRTGYVALYRSDVAAAAVYVLAFRHRREAGY